MSWHFSQALVAAYSADTCSNGAPSAPLSGSPIPQAFLSPDRMKAFSRLSRFGMTCEPLTDDLGAGVLTWCLVGSHAKTSAQPAKAQESTESAAECGRTWHESFARWDRATLSWRTPQCSLLEGLDEFSETWPQWGMMRDGECSVQSMPALLTSEIESGLWPTIRAADGERGGRGDLIQAIRGNQNSHFKSWPTPKASVRGDCPSERLRNTPDLASSVKMWPTPDTCAGGTGPSQMKRNQPRLQDAVKFATPQARDFRSGSTERWDDPDRSRNLNDQVGGQLNPTWVEWLMGWPLGWTDLKPSGTDKFPQWRRSHGGF